MLILRDLSKIELPANVPSITGISVIEEHFGEGSTTSERVIQRERWKSESAFTNNPATLRLAHDFLDQAEFANARVNADSRLVNELIRDAASLRFAAAGRLAASVSVVTKEGGIERMALTDPNHLPDNALVNVVRTFRYDQDYFQSSATRLQNELASGSGYGGRRGAVLDAARDLDSRASVSFAAGDIAAARVWVKMAIGVLDVATRFIPGIDWGRDIYEAVSGRDLFSGEPLDKFERVGAVIGVITAGVGSEIFGVGRVLRRLEELPIHEVEEVYEFAQTVDRSTKLRYTVHAEKRMADRFVSREDVLKVLDDHTPFWSVEHQSYTAVGKVEGRRIGVAIGVPEGKIRTVMVEDNIPFEDLRFTDGENIGRRRLEKILLDE